MTSGTERLLIFTVGGTRYALDLRAVAEVLAPPATSPVPWAPPWLKGAMNFHGSLVAVLDLATFMNVCAVPVEGDALVLDRSIANLALRVDRVEQIVQMDVVLEDCESSDPLVERVLIMADGEVGLLAIEKLLQRIEENMKR